SEERSFEAPSRSGDECLRHEAQGGERVTIVPQRRLILRATLDVLEDEPRHAPPRYLTQIRDVQSACGIASVERPPLPGHVGLLEWNVDSGSGERIARGIVGADGDHPEYGGRAVQGAGELTRERARRAERRDAVGRIADGELAAAGDRD